MNADPHLCATADCAISGCVDEWSRDALSGWAWNPAQPEKAVTVEVRLDMLLQPQLRAWTVPGIVTLDEVCLGKGLPALYARTIDDDADGHSGSPQLTAPNARAATCCSTTR